MVAPIDAKASFEAGGESFTLHLNFRTLALAKKAGVNLFGGGLDPLDIAVAVRCLASPSHPNLTDDEAFALVVSDGEAAATAIAELFTQFGASAEGKAKPKK
jgi:hypothetical protein